MRFTRSVTHQTRTQSAFCRQCCIWSNVQQNSSMPRGSCAGEIRAVYQGAGGQRREEYDGRDRCAPLRRDRPEGQHLPLRGSAGPCGLRCARGSPGALQEGEAQAPILFHDRVFVSSVSASFVTSPTPPIRAGRGLPAGPDWDRWSGALPLGGRKPSPQRGRAAAAQLRALHHRSVSHQPIRAASTRGESTAPRSLPAQGVAKGCALDSPGSPRTAPAASF